MANSLIRMLPFVLDSESEVFSFKDCRFANQQAKEETARIVAFKELSIVNSYTLESSLHGTDGGGLL